MSIRQNQEPTGLPDFCNFGIWLRVLIGSNALAVLAVFAANRTLADFPQELLATAAVFEPPLIASLALLCALRRLVERLSYRQGVALAIIIAMATTAAAYTLLLPLIRPGGLSYGVARAVLWSALLSASVLFYFNVRAKLQSPALAEARLLALTARIRPHFLFNALNAVLGVIRSDARRAEQALEELSDLFRVLMRENRDLVPLSEEISLAQHYLDIERLRLGERLQVDWDIDDCPPDAMVPPLMLQPLLENAVYHGIEPAEKPGAISIHLTRNGDQLIVELSNPYAAGSSAHVGNRMALANIRERLMLFYDLEARLESGAANGRYQVRIVMPYRPGVEQ